MSAFACDVVKIVSVVDEDARDAHDCISWCAPAELLF